MTDEIITSKAQVADLVGLRAEQIGTVEMQLNILRQRGILVDLSITGTGMFSRSASFAELGVQDDSKLERYTPGTKFLVPKEVVNRLRSVETRMRQALDHFTMSVTGFKPYRWLAIDTWEAWRARWQELQDEFYGIKAEILANLDHYRDLISDEFAAGARATWASIKGQGYEAIIWNSKGYLSEESFVDAVVEKALGLLPSEAEIQTSLQADYTVAMVYGASDIAQDLAQAQTIQAQAQAAKAEADAKSYQAYLDEKAATEAYQHQRLMNDIEAQARQAKLEEIMAIEMEHVREQMQQLGSPLVEVVRELRNRIGQDAQAMLESIQKNGFVRGKVAQKGRGLIDFYELMSTHNDRDLRAKLEALKAQIGNVGESRAKDAPDRDVDLIESTLNEIVDLAAADLEALTQVSRAAFLEV